jgi:hypothetical protein
MRKFLSHSLKALALSAVVLGGTASAAQASNANGIPLRPGQTCGIQVYLSNSGGVVMPKVDGRMSGSYRFRLYQAIPTSDVNINLGGRFNATGSGSTTLARNTFALGYVVPGGFRGMDELRDAELGQDAALVGSLQVYDAAGRLSCSSNGVQVMPMALLTGVRRPSRPVVRAPAVRQPENARLAHERMAQRDAAQPVTRRLTPEQCRRLSRGRIRQCN